MVLEAVKALSAEEITELCLRHTLYDWTAQAGLKPLPVVSAKGVHFDTADGRRFRSTDRGRTWIRTPLQEF